MTAVKPYVAEPPVEALLAPVARLRSLVGGQPSVESVELSTESGCGVPRADELAIAPALVRDGAGGDANARTAALFTVRAVHSAIFLAMLASIIWLVATGVGGRRGRSAQAAAALIAAESVVFLGNGGTCPLTPLAERYGAADGRVSDIFLPDALARTVPCWSIPLVITGVALHLRAWRRCQGDPA